MILPSIIRDIALKAAQAEYKHTRWLGGSAQDATIAGAAVVLEIRELAGWHRTPTVLAAPPEWWVGS